MTERRHFRSESCPSRETGALGVTVEIGGIPISLRGGDPDFCGLIEQRYAGFVNPKAQPAFEFEFDLDSPAEPSNEDARVFKKGFVWFFERGDFRAAWDVRSRRGRVRQSPNPYSLDTVLRIAHTLVLAGEGGFLIHAASAIRDGRAFLFSGVSGAGKTTMARLAPPDADVLTDEISYVRRCKRGYRAYGTPFAGELARVGANLSAPLDTLYFLVQGPENRVEPVSPSDAARALLRHILFFACDRDLVQRVFDAALAFVSSVNVAKLVFTPDSRAWELIQ
ncbi:MAG TPA: hypothetical protein VLY23_03965 [Candidatus Acidoferrum sp.]|nr:hypothetical protein [Candidatus Acidoferrum sp.]